jgi:ribonuclease P protein component
MREADLPAEQPEAQEEARIPVADAHPRGARRSEDPSPARPRPAVGLIWRVRGHAAFRDLARAPVRRHGALSARLVPGDPGTPPRVAFAIGRPVGGAVARNRLRRRLRAALRALQPELVPGGAYLVGAGPAAVTATPAELRDALRAVLREVRERRPERERSAEAGATRDGEQPR